jgi:hypothetical protein
MPTVLTVLIERGMYRRARKYRGEEEMFLSPIHNQHCQHSDA